MAYDCSIPPPGDHFYENKPSAYDYSTPTPGYATYGFKRNDATSPSGKYPYPYTTKEQQANEPSRPDHTRQASYSSLASLNPGSIRPKFQGADLSPELLAPDESDKKHFEEAHNPFAFSPGQLNKILNPKPMASCKGLGGLNDLEQGPQTDVAGVKYSSVEPLATKNHPSKPRRVDHPSRSPGPAKPLWDPNNDDPTTRRTTRRDRQSGHANKPFRHPHSSSGLRSKPRKPGVVREWSNVANLQEQTLSTDPHVTQFDSSRKPRILGKQELPPGDGPSEGLETPPEMLLQPDIIPISHEQLVQEVKGIYAGLVIVEAKCIDIDERQSVSAQVKDLSKKIELENAQRQSIIALRKKITLSLTHSRVGSLLRTKQGLLGFANGSSIAAMADTGSRKNVMSASYAKKLDLKIEGLPSTFAIGNSRKIQSVGKYTHICLSFFDEVFQVVTVIFELTLNYL